jgi:hypothetical protein
MIQEGVDAVVQEHTAELLYAPWMEKEAAKEICLVVSQERVVMFSEAEYLPVPAADVDLDAARKVCRNLFDERGLIFR